MYWFSCSHYLVYSASSIYRWLFSEESDHMLFILYLSIS